jgi:predicted anti-sigma-YlaC factor YlaD
MNCKQAQSHSFDYLENKLDESLFHQVDKHISECQACAADFNSLGRSLQSVQHFKQSSPEVSFYFTQKTMNAINELQHTESSVWHWMAGVLFKKVSVVAASVTAIFAGIILGIFLNMNYNTVTGQQTLPESETIEEVYLAGTSDEYMMQFFENLYYRDNGNE